MNWKMTTQKPLTPKDAYLTLYVDLSEWDMTRVDLDPFERELLRECGNSKLLSDKLLALETVVRRMEEQKLIPVKP